LAACLLFLAVTPASNREGRRGLLGAVKVSADSGNGPLLDPLLADSKDRVFGAGGERASSYPKPGYCSTRA
jgi:hypothetical protein